MVLRIFASFVLLISVLFMPFWVSMLLAAGLMLYFPVFWETVLLFLLSDLLFGVAEARFFGITYVSFIAALLFLIGLEIIKKKLKFYPG
ncbi:hypothetical protein A3C67_00485 [Candidatus Nomurabacteria bacterium RIFCSPHIGHO2_02_FULL_42_19]|uniref:Uncharacterized protein n=1 Tax=Candidatus Nomurabacteria bacterium RIFCSPHIGHO2_02_FULL_42_19 TaxID=1801756 RepID=A0A1F6W289_9BACT|nr:MAG: hypothetical protein A3C67_00485 [Candidatus Nomurabacteria bacterium RIFCSPHIGHO2_02_FULL_42_19]